MESSNTPTLSAVHQGPAKRRLGGQASAFGLHSMQAPASFSLDRCVCGPSFSVLELVQVWTVLATVVGTPLCGMTAPAANTGAPTAS